MGVVCTIVAPPFFRAPFVLEPLIKPCPIGGGRGGRGGRGGGRGGVEVGGRRVMDKYEEAVLGALSVRAAAASSPPSPSSSSSLSSSPTTSSVCSLSKGPPFCSFDLTPPAGGGGGGGRMTGQKTSMYSITQRLFFSLLFYLSLLNAPIYPFNSLFFSLFRVLSFQKNLGWMTWHQIDVGLENN